MLAVAGTHVVVLGWDLPLDRLRADGVLGFSIRRHRHRDGERTWLTGLKTFERVDPHPPPGLGRSSFLHPFQTFQWADWDAVPGETYTYRVVARAGVPGALTDVAAVDVTVTTERVDQGRHAVFFNRGSIASQEYARVFQNRDPDEVGPSAFEWLSRGLHESLLGFVGQAQADDALHGAFFELEDDGVLQALAAARDRRVDVRIVYAADGDQKTDNEAAIARNGIQGLCSGRTRSGRYAHNKFLVLSRGGHPAEVWTGSTNLSTNGIFGHSNNAHLVRDVDIAAEYERAWAIQLADQTLAPTRTAHETAFGWPPAPPTASGDTAVAFSPRRTDAALTHFAELAGGAERALFMTFAFGMHRLFSDVYDHDDGVIRFALMESEGSGSTLKEQAAALRRVRRHPNVTVAIGSSVQTTSLDRWLVERERATATAHVLFVHTKYMLVDPLGPHPTVVVGSANFSKASADTNDENMLVIRDQAAVADVYLGEFMRLFNHYAFRESLRFRGGRPVADPRFLVAEPAWFEAGYFTEGRDRFLRRVYFSGG